MAQYVHVTIFCASSLTTGNRTYDPHSRRSPDVGLSPGLIELGDRERGRDPRYEDVLEIDHAINRG